MFNTILFPLVNDCERNDGTQAKPFYMSKRLMKIFRKKRMPPQVVEQNNGDLDD